MNELHEKILEFVLAYRKKHPDFVCWFRQRDTRERLSNGFWFQGNEDYVFVGLYDASGGSNMTRSVGIVFWYDKKAPGVMGAHLEVVYNEEKDKRMIDFYQSIVAAHGPFEQQHGSKYNRGIGYGSSVFASVEQFLDNEKPQIDQLINQKGLQKLFITNASFETQLRGILQLRAKSSPANGLIEHNQKEIIMNQPLNTILYGPPGTGKTYHTINKAIEIVNPDYDFIGKTRMQVRDEYDRLVKAQKIEFCTFHQSLSYEDFIEGIKPVVIGDNAPIQYKVLPGIFKRIAARAGYMPDVQTKVFSITDEQFTKAQFYKMSLGDSKDVEDDAIFQYCIDNGCIALGWGDDINFTGKSERDITQMANNKEIERFEGIAVNYFIHFIKPGDYVMISRGNTVLRAIGKVTGAYEYKPDSPIRYHQFRKVEWILKDKDIPVNELYNKNFSQQTIYQLDKKQVKKDFFVKAQSATVTTATKPEKYVLIIDEINRGNVSSIFGELITLIEEDKRRGNKEALTAILPYSGENFSVPNNLYIIGTMNTADRSVEALDTALRRRFSFEEMTPDSKLLIKDDGTDKMVSGISLKALLDAINERIAYLLDDDHRIGHSYFYDIAEGDVVGLMAAFSDKIIPLLKEYFYNDYEKILLVLGSSFVTEQKKKPVFAGKKQSDIDRAVFVVNNITDKDIFINALKITLNAQ